MFTSAPRTKSAEPPHAGDAYQRRKTREAKRQAVQAAAGRDIGPIPPVADPKRRARATKSLATFCKTYLAEVFTLPWSDDHRTVIAKMQTCAIRGGLFAEAMPRGSGKTSLAEALAIWAVLTHRRRFVALIGADQGSAGEMLESIKITLETNELLAADFPETIFPILQLERISNRCKGQLCEGKPTYITWTADRIRLPTTPGNPPGAVVTTSGITGRIRGLNYKLPNGENLRPDLAIIDDPQTDESAKSLTMTDDRENVINGAVLALPGPDKKLAAIMPCTVIRENDLAARFLDRARHPDWQGERLAMVYQWPTGQEAQDLWTEYGKILADDLAAGRPLDRATAFYRKNRRAMDAGAVVAWPARHNDDELSALQHAYNLRARDPRAFAAEFQNDPLPAYQETDLPQLNVDRIMRQTNGYTRREIPPDTECLTGFIDVQKNALFYAVAAWRKDFGGYIVDWGTFPDQKTDNFAYRSVRYTLARAFPGQQLEGQLFHGLETVIADLFSDKWDGYRPDLVLIDANWGESTDTVYSVCRQTRQRVYPSHGRGIGARQLPMSEWRGDGKHGLHWFCPAPKTKRQIRHVVYDTNYWKNHAAERLLTEPNDAGSLTMHRGKHELFANHLASEYRIGVTANGRTVYEWELRPDRQDNHWWDCLVGSAVAASICGVTIKELAGNASPKRTVRGRRTSKAKVSYL